MNPILFALVIVALSPTTAEVTPTPSAAAGGDNEILARVQARYSKIRQLTLLFVERYESSRTGTAVEESGLLWIERPGKMRWEYRLPEAKLFVIDQGDGWFYVPEDDVAYRIRASSGEARSLPLQFLAGSADLSRDYDSRALPTKATDTTLSFELRPRRGGESYDHFVLEVDAVEFALKTLAVVDALGNVTRFGFSDERQGESPPPDAFRFEPPPEVEIVDNDAR